MISRLPEKSIPDWLAKISQNTITNDPFPLTKVLEDSLYYPASGFDVDPVKYLAGNILSFIYVDYGKSYDEFENEMDLRGFRGYDRVATRLVDEQELTPSGWSPIQPTQYQGERSSNEWFDYEDLEIVGFKIFHLKNREAQFKILSNKIESLKIRSAILNNYLSGFDQWIDRLEVQKSDLQDMNLLQRESALKEIHDRQQES